MVLKEADPLVQAALLGQDSGLADQQGAIGAQLVGGQCARQHLAQGPLAPRHMLLQLLGVFLLPLQEPQSLQQRGLEPRGEGAVSGARAPPLPGGFQPEPAGPSPPRPPPAQTRYLLVRVAVCARPGQGAVHAVQATAQQQQEAKHTL